MQNDLLAPPTAHRGSGCPDLTSSTASPPVCGPDFQKLLLEKKSKTPSEASLTSELDSQNWQHCPPCGSRESEAMADGKSVLWTSTSSLLNLPTPPPLLPPPSTGLGSNGKSILSSVSPACFSGFVPRHSDSAAREEAENPTSVRWVWPQSH